MPVTAGTLYNIRANTKNNWFDLGTSNGTIGNYRNAYAYTTGTSTTLTNNYWVVWNSAYTNTTNIQVQGNGAWAFRTGGDWIDERFWYGWNEKYEETVERKHQQFITQVLHTARSTARYHGTTFEDYLASVRQNAEQFSDDELRLIEDAFQRGREERLEDERRQEQARLAAEERDRLLAEANRRAELLLRSLLTHEQKQEWLSHRRVTEVAPSGRVWRLFPQWAGGATLMEGEVRRATLCVHPRDRVPDIDNIAALLVALRGGDEDHLIQIAILHGGHWTAQEEEIRRGRRVTHQPVAGGYIAVPQIA